MARSVFSNQKVDLQESETQFAVRQRMIADLGDKRLFFGLPISARLGAVYL
jgi:hypothetical protein